MGEVPRGLADGADERPKHRASHQTRTVLQQMVPVLVLSLPVGVAELANIRLYHLLHVSWRLQRQESLAVDYLSEVYPNTY